MAFFQFEGMYDEEREAFIILVSKTRAFFGNCLMRVGVKLSGPNADLLFSFLIITFSSFGVVRTGTVRREEKTVEMYELLPFSMDG